jgi:hypothetical protein
MFIIVKTPETDAPDHPDQQASRNIYCKGSPGKTVRINFSKPALAKKPGHTAKASTKTY